MAYWDSSLNITSLSEDYQADIKPEQVVEAIYERIESYKAIQHSVWIHLQPKDSVIRAAKQLHARWPDPNNRPGLWGIPFSVKDSIDIAGIPTTAGCPDLAFTPNSSAPVYQRCIEAGGLFIGKTNMEQLATGMTGCRSPYGTLHSTWSKAHCVGGSSSGSAVTVSEGLVSFSLGSDTAGSIRVPALFNGIVGFKPTKGTVSTRGVYPACAHQDCVSFLAGSVEDAEKVWRICQGFDKNDFLAKRDFMPKPSLASKLFGDGPSIRFGVPPGSALEACSPEYRRLFGRAVEAIQDKDMKLVELDWTPFAAANELLYNGSFVLERLTILPEGWFDKNKQLLHPVTRQVFEGALARKSSAVDLFRDLHKQAEYKRAVEDILTLEDRNEYLEDKGKVFTVMVVPTTPFHPTIEEVGEDPLGINGKLGAFAHFANVLDLVGVAIPCGSYTIGDEQGTRSRLPFGVTILAGAGLEEDLLILAKRLEAVFQDLHDDGRAE